MKRHTYIHNKNIIKEEETCLCLNLLAHTKITTVIMIDCKTSYMMNVIRLDKIQKLFKI